MHEWVIVVTLSVYLSLCVSLFDFGEGAVFRVKTYISMTKIQFKSFKCSPLLEIEAILEKK